MQIFGKSETFWELYDLYDLNLQHKRITKNNLDKFI